MAVTWEFHHTSANPTGLISTVGGIISGALVAGNLNELFTFVSSPPSGVETELFQYRKLHIKNVSTATITGVKFWLDSVEHSGQVFMGIEHTNEQIVTGATGSAPSNVRFDQPDSFTNGTGIGTATFAPSYSTGLWLRVGLSGVDEPDPYASMRLNVGGIEQ